MPQGEFSVAVTGAAGNLGTKAIKALSASGVVRRILAIDLQPTPVPSSSGCEIIPVLTDLSAQDDGLAELLAGTDTLFHLAARNPFPDASWQDAQASFQMTMAVVQAAIASGVHRLVLASSNHVMGGYKDLPLATMIGPGCLTEALPPAPGTMCHVGGRLIPGTAYATSKLFAESTFLNAASAQREVVCLRIGWCQTGANHPATITADGLQDDLYGTGPGPSRDLRWFRNMWLSDRDFTQIVRLACTGPLEPNAPQGVVVNAMSDNAGMPWSLEAARRVLGYSPQDDVWTGLGDKGLECRL